MKIPLLSPSGQVNVPGIDAGAMTAESRAMQGFGAQLAKTAEVVSDLEIKKKNIKEKNDAFLSIIDAKKKAIDLSTELSTITDDAEYMEAWNTGWKDIEKGTLSGVSSSGTNQLVQKALGEIFIQEYGNAKRHSNTLLIEGQQGKVIIGLNALQDIAETTTDPDVISGIKEMGDAIIFDNASSGMIKQDDAARMRETQSTAVDKRSKLAVERLAKAAISAGTFKPEDYPQLDSDTLYKLTSMNETKERQRVAEKDREARRIEKDTKDRQENNTFDFSIKISRGKYVFDEVMTAAENREIGRTDFDYLRELPGKIGQGPHPNDEAMKREYGPDIHSINPKISITQVRNWIQTNQMSATLGLQWVDRLRESATVGRDQSKSDIRYRHSQAEQEGIQNLTTTSPFEKLDPVAKDLQNAIVAELRRRSSAYNGGEDPLKVLDEVLPRYKKVLQDRQMMASEEMKKMLRYPTPQALEDAYKAKSISKGEYESQKRIFIDLSIAMGLEEAAKQRAKEQGQRK